MDFEDDPDITPWHLSQRMKMFEKMAKEEEEERKKLTKLLMKGQDPERMLYTYKNIAIRVVLAIGFLTLCIGLLVFSISNGDNNEEVATTAFPTPPPINPFHSMNCTGDMTVAFVSSSRTEKFGTVWQQDDANQWLKVSLGDRRSCESFIADLYFLNNETYVIYTNDSSCSQLFCVHDTNYTYYQEISQYGSQNFAFTAAANLPKSHGRFVYVYSGRIFVEGSEEAVQKFVGVQGILLEGMMRIPSINSTIAFYEFLYSDISDDAPELSDEVDQLRQHANECTESNGELLINNQPIPNYILGVIINRFG